MDDKMKEDILESWNSWKWDIWESNRSDWDLRDESILQTIEILLRKELTMQYLTKLQLNTLIIILVFLGFFIWFFNS